ncbi:chorismate--pyruvate lyase family protein [Idiomarina sp. HP20-50]|uniref:chorismate--pyruvate lyase family protein n=1 Tax=Idiomarina sp. HP20-50 TaxID=3070813 RepID=UPI00294B74EF|nr:chorismate lyase [Idiomarina sp. HP20-50]MDV6317244.1 chorismate lyase [Idiomarina sp. HP20-50]
MTTEFYPTPAFPISEALQWRPSQQLKLTSDQASWLLYEGSLTQRLKQVGQQFSVTLLGQQLLSPHAEEKQRLDCKDAVVVREVLLYCDNQPWVFARSLFSPSAESTSTLNLQKLGNQSLGESLFARDDLEYGPIEVAEVSPEHPVAQLNQQWFQQKRSLLGRRRMFSTAGEQLLVSEIFLEPSSLYPLPQ